MTDQQHKQNRTAVTKALPNTPPNAPESWKPLNVRERLEARLTQSEATKLVAIMLASYPASRSRDGGAYIDGLAGALSRQPKEIATMCADPQHGIATECMFKPTIADIVRWCELRNEPLVKMMRTHAAKVTKIDKFRIDTMKSEAQIAEERKMRESIDELRARHGPNWGIRRMYDPVTALKHGTDIDEEQERERTEARLNARAVAQTEAAILAEYARLKLDPVYVSDGMLVSPSLVAALKARR